MAEVISQEQFINKMVVQHDFDRFFLLQLFKKAKVKKSIIRAMTPRKRSKKGKKRPWYKYRRKFLTKSHINGGVKFWRNNSKTLARAETIYGVPAEIIVAIIGVETIYGKNKGSFRVIDALKTLSFHYTRRADFFRSELEHYLLLTREEGQNPLYRKGSYAGAMGIGQFMPSSFRRYAVDFNGDGKRNIWTSNVDAIGSVANYFQKFGWKTGEPVMEATQVHPEAVESLLTLEFEPKYTIRQLKRWGLLYYGDRPSNSKAMFIDLRTKQGTVYWLGFQNFYVITRYNHSKHYAMAVYQLAQEIAKKRYAQIH